MEECIKYGFVPEECKLPLFLVIAVVLIALALLTRRLDQVDKNIAGVFLLALWFVMFCIVSGVVRVFIALMIVFFILLVVRLFERESGEEIMFLSKHYKWSAKTLCGMAQRQRNIAPL